MYDYPRHHVIPVATPVMGVLTTARTDATETSRDEESTSEEGCLNTKNASNLLLFVALIYGLIVWNSMESGTTNDWAELFNEGLVGNAAVVLVSLCFSLICCASLFGCMFQCRAADAVKHIKKTER